MPAILLVLSSCRTGNSANRIKSDENPSKPGTVESNQPDNNPADRKKQNAGQLTSGETTEVPWEKDNDFKAALEKNNAPILLAAYRTVLKDPLPGEEYNVHLAARLLAGIVVKPGGVFSQNRNIGPYTKDKGYQKGPTYIGTELATTIGGGVCKIASTLYNVTILSNLPVIERHFHNMPVPYVPYGQDATVTYDSKDFRFENDNSYPVLIWAQGVDNILYIGFYGKTKTAKVQWHHEKLEAYPAPKVYRTNTGLPAGTEKPIHEGMDGAVVKSWVTIERQNGQKSILELGKSYYAPMPHIIERNKQPENE